MVMMAKLVLQSLSSKFSTPPPPPITAFSRFYRRSRRPPAPVKDEEPLFLAIGKMVLKYALTGAFIHGVFVWVDYGAYGATAAEWDRLKAEIQNEGTAYDKELQELDELRAIKKRRRRERKMASREVQKLNE